jgi:hypothetical protein
MNKENRGSTFLPLGTVPFCKPDDVRSLPLPTSHLAAHGAKAADRR